MWKTRPRAWHPDNPIFLQFICSLHSVSFSLLSVPCFALPAGALPYPCPSLGDGGLIQERLVIWVVRSPDSLIRHRGDPSPCGQNPLNFEFNSLAAWKQCLRLAKTCIFFIASPQKRETPSTCRWHHTRASRWALFRLLALQKFGHEGNIWAGTQALNFLLRREVVYGLHADPDLLALLHSLTGSPKPCFLPVCQKTEIRPRM